MTKREVTLVNEWGLHARPAFTLAKTAMRFKSRVCMENNGVSADLKLVTDILSLCAGKGDTLLLMAEGEDELEAADEIAALVAAKFGEEK
ncbi:MAG: HPr family phosphocarrier protein [Nitrospinae bacterium]|nr:HPr family phosphocarrier protein [Nitrospinota bacterium]MBF0634933.1 HPr family phosphocarrier protein [Nitrospinota bacterium]